MFIIYAFISAAVDSPGDSFIAHNIYSSDCEEFVSPVPSNTYFTAKYANDLLEFKKKIKMNQYINRESNKSTSDNDNDNDLN